MHLEHKTPTGALIHIAQEKIQDMQITKPIPTGARTPLSGLPLRPVLALAFYTVLCGQPLLSFQSDADPRPHNKLALVIGNDRYTVPLHNAVNDALSMKHLLTAAGFNVTLVTDASLSVMGSSIDRFVATVNKGDAVVFYYSGHGFQTDGENYLAPIDFAASDRVTARYRAYPAARILDNLSARSVRLTIMILDACRNDPFNTARGGPVGLAAMASGAGTFIAFATAPGGIASDNPSGTNGLFTRAILQHMTTPGITIEDTFARVRSQVHAESGGQQTPWTASGLYYPFVLSRQAGAEAPDVAASRGAPAPVFSGRNNIPAQEAPPPLGTPNGSIQSDRAAKFAPTSAPASLSVGNEGVALSGTVPAIKGLPAKPGQKTAGQGVPLATSPTSGGARLDGRAPRGVEATEPPQEFLIDTATQIRDGSNLADVEKRLSDFLTGHPRNADATILQVELFLVQGRLQDGLASVGSALQFAPLNPLPLYLRSLAEALLGQYELAIRDCDIGLSTYPKDEHFLVAKANILFVVGRFRESIVLCDQALATDPSFPAAYVIRGNCSKALGNLKGADDDFARASELQSAGGR